MQTAANTIPLQGRSRMAGPVSSERFRIHNRGQKNAAATTNLKAPTQKEESCGGAKLCAVPVVPQSMAANTTMAILRKD